MIIGFDNINQIPEEYIVLIMIAWILLMLAFIISFKITLYMLEKYIKRQNNSR